MTDTQAMKAAKEIDELRNQYEKRPELRWQKVRRAKIAAIIEKHQAPSVPVSELKKRKRLYAETIGTESHFAQFVQNEFSELIRQAQQEKQT